MDVFWIRMSDETGVIAESFTDKLDRVRSECAYLLAESFDEGWDMKPGRTLTVVPGKAELVNGVWKEPA